MQTRKKTPQKVYVNAEFIATITCPQCDKSRTMHVELFLHARRPIKVQCGCGNAFPIRLEGRKYYRKDAELPGTYAYVENAQAGRLVVETLSFSGIGFRTMGPHTIHVDDLLLVSFTLDNAKQTPMQKWVVVRWVNDQRIGTEFHDIDLYDKEMGVYLMPI
jgi:PilZ domain